MASKLKGFIKLFCEKCIQRMALTPEQYELMANAMTPKEFRSLATWHFDASETKATIDCCDCKVYPVLDDRRDRKQVVAVSAIIPKWEKGVKSEVVTRSYERGPDSLLTRLGIDDGIVTAYDPTLKTCSFCGNQVSHVNLTTGLASLKVEKEEKVVWDNPVVIDVTTKVTATKATACPSCAHLIKPIMHKVNGKDEIKVRNAQFGYDEG